LLQGPQVTVENGLKNRIIMGRKIAILQSNYIPWKGYFDIINMVDEFILYDDMQYTKRNWRNRNRIMTPDGPIWIAIPVQTKGKFSQKINETKVVDNSWVDKHWMAIQCNYSKAKYFDEYAGRIEAMYEACRQEPYLSKINYIFLTGICDILGIDTKISWSSDYELADGKTERLVELVKTAKGNYYLSGPAAKDYIIPELFEKAAIELDWMDYTGYREYRQLGSSFCHEVSILDLIFNEGPDAGYYLKSIQR